MPARKVLLIGWDAADWKVIRPLIEAGKMPNLRTLAGGGASGPISTLHPPLSPMLWTSIATGKRPFKHGILGFSEPTPDGRGVQPITNLSRRSKALWNILQQNGLRSTVVGWWPSHPAEPISGVMVSDLFHRAGGPLEGASCPCESASGPCENAWPLPANSVHPVRLNGQIAALRTHPDQLKPRMVEPFIPLAKEIDQDKDKRLAGFLRTLAECMSIQSAAHWLLNHEPWDFFAVYYDSIDHFSHGFMRYHPPRQPWIGERDFELYHNVVSMAYQLHDEMLGALLKSAGEDTTVILLSDHGFHPDHLRPASIPDIPAGPAIEHRDFGVFAMRGPDIRENAALGGASLLDVAPTVLTLYGLPVGEDMDGKVLSQAFAETPEISFLLSWDDVSGEDGQHPFHARQDPVAAREALDQMVALGYIERPDEDSEVAVTKTLRELRYNLGESYQDDGRHTDAHNILAELYAADPNEMRFAVRLFVSAQALGMHEEMRRIVADLDGRRRELYEEALEKIPALGKVVVEPDPETIQPITGGGGPHFTVDERRELAHWRNLARYQPAVVDYLKAQIFISERRHSEALAALQRVSETSLVRPGLFLETADLYLCMGRLRAAQQVYEQAVAIDSDNARAHIGLCQVALRRRRFDLAARSALDALERVPYDPVAHFLLGRALQGIQQYERAAEAFREALALNPHFPEAHLRLAALLETHLGDSAGADEHRRLGRHMRRAAASRRRTGLVESLAECRQNNALRQLPVSTVAPAEMPPLEDSLIVVTGLPRSGTSMLMQMLAAGGLSIVADERRAADEDNPRGYFEFEPVKNLLRDSHWLLGQRGKAIKIVAPLLAALPPGLPCRVILCERNVEEVLDSQGRMLRRTRQPVATTPERRQMLKDEYGRAIARAKAMLARRPDTALLIVEHRDTIRDPRGTAEKLNRFLGGGLDAARMAAAVDRGLYQNRGSVL